MAGGWKAADVAAVAAYAKALAPDTVLALVAEEVRKDSPFAKIAEVLRLRGFREEARAMGGRAVRAARRDVRQPDACRLLVEFVGENL